MEKVLSVFLCVLLISVPFLPLTSTGRVPLDKPQKDDESGGQSNDRDKMGVKGSYSSPAHSATGHSSPSHATPSKSKEAAIPDAKGTAYADNLPCATNRECRTAVPGSKGTTYATNLPAANSSPCATNRECRKTNRHSKK